MNKVILKGIIKDIQFSHKIGDTEYNKANLIVAREDGKEDILSIRFKKFSNTYEEGQEISIIGNLRSFSQKLEDGKNKVQLYVFTYFDLPTEEDSELIEESNNYVQIDGRICKLEDLRTTQSGKQNIHLVLANNIISQDGRQKLNNYIPTTAWGKLAEKITKFNISDKVVCTGQLHSRVYKKLLNNDEFELRTAHELIIQSIELQEN